MSEPKVKKSEYSSTVLALMHALLAPARDDNSDTGIRYLSSTRSDGYRYGDNFLPAGGIRTQSESRRVQEGYFFSPAGNPTGTQYFTTDMILGCEQVKMCSFCYINYDFFWLLNFATLLS
jgi:hypothetical protein